MHLNFVKSFAVWSVFCYMIQLGDRHFDNILITTDKCTIIHIDFDCIFSKGKVLPVPEIVDFRLTLNVLASMGLASCFGLFRQYFFMTAKVFAKNKESIINSFRIFDIDPIHEKLRTRRFERIDMIQNALQIFENYQTEKDLNFLFNKNQNIEKLSDMFVGWCPHI